jgi:transposase
MKILSIDMGKYKSVACDYLRETAEHEFEALATEPAAFHDLIAQRNPDVVVIEISPAAGWVRDLCESLGKELVVANTSDEPWRWKNVKRKSDRDDALRLAKLQAMNQIGKVHVPALEVRQWRSLIHYRVRLVEEVTSIKNRIRALVDQVALDLPGGEKAFSEEGRKEWEQQYSKPLADCSQKELWKGMIHLELQRMGELAGHLAEVEQKLRDLARGDERIKRLRTAPGVGERTAELVVALFDDPNRFTRGKQVGNYAGLTPKKYQSGTMDHDGRISRGGDGLLRAYLIQAAWVAIRTSQDMKAVYERVLKGSAKRKKKAITAVARHLIVRLWAMLRDQSSWRESSVAQAA